MGHQPHPLVHAYLVVLLTQTAPRRACVCATQKRFVWGEIHKHSEVWDRLSQELPNRMEILGWIDHGVSVYDYLQHFSGQFGGVNYDSGTPVPRVFKNNE